jgi:hypothetical protein
VGAELAEALNTSAEKISRQLKRARDATRDSVAVLVLARTGSGHCAALASELSVILDEDQQQAGRKLVLDPPQSRVIADHATGCPTCAPRAEEAREYSRWALGPGLLGLAPDDDERRRAIIALFSRGSAPPPSMPAVAVAEPVAAGLVGRIQAAATTRLARMPGTDAVMQFAQQNPEAFRRILAGAVGGAVAAVAIVVALLANPEPPGEHIAAPPAQVDEVTKSPVADTVPDGPTSSPTPSVTPTSPPSATSTTPAPAPAAAPARATGGPVPAKAPAAAANPPPPAIQESSSEASPRAETSTSTPVVANGDIGFDLTGTDYAGFMITGDRGWQDTRQVRTARLEPGSYFLTPQAGNRIPFQVTATRQVEYDSRYDRIVSGRGTSTLTVHGIPVTYDTTDIDYTNMTVSGVAFRPAQKVRTLRLLPGAHRAIAVSGHTVDFSITDSGRVDYPTASENLLTGRGSSTLAVHGKPITLDSTDVDYTNMAIGGTGWPAPQKIRVARLLPGWHVVASPVAAQVAFRVTESGSVDYESRVDSLLTGRGSSILAVHGKPITLDSTDVDYDNMAIGGTGWLAPQKMRTLRLLPGSHVLASSAVPQLAFRVTESGSVDYESRVDSLLTGRGSSTLAVHGKPITIDNTGTDYTNLAVGGTGWLAPQKIRTLRLLPGPHIVVSPTAAKLDFRVTETGSVEYESSLLTGRGTSTLAVHGVTITFDMAALDYNNTAVGGTGWLTAQKVRSLRLLPGAHTVATPTGQLIGFTVTPAAKVDYPSNVEHLLSGRGSATLTGHPVQITVDARDSGYTAFQITGVTGLWASNQSRTFRLWPGTHRFAPLNAESITMRVSQDGQVDYDHGVDTFVSGRGSSTFTVRRR